MAMYLICKTLAVKNERLYKKLTNANFSDKEKYEIRLEIAANHLNLVEYNDFWSNIEIAEKYAKEYVSEDLLPIKLMKLAAAFKTNRQTEIERLKKEIHLHYFADDLLSQINFKMNDYYELQTAFEKFLADIYILYYGLTENYYQELSASEEMHDKHCYENNKLQMNIGTKTKEEMLFFCAVAVDKFVNRNQQNNDDRAAGLLFAKLLTIIFEEKDIHRLVNLYLDEALSSISEEQENKFLLMERAKLILRYVVNNTIQTRDTKNVLKHGRILMIYGNEKTAGEHTYIVLSAAYHFIMTWITYYVVEKNEVFSTKEKNRIVSYIKENLHACLDIYFAEYNIECPQTMDLFDKLEIFEEDKRQNDNRQCIAYIDDYVHILLLDKKINNKIKRENQLH